MQQIYRRRFLRTLLRNWRKLGSEMLISCGANDGYDGHEWSLLGCTDHHQQSMIPKDVPKGHMVVYVGEDYKRFVIRVTLLNHPLFRPLLDRAQEVYEFNPDAKLCIPCDETIFLAVVRCVMSEQGRRIWLCL